jgi:alanyl-tRNA synthetase
MENLNFRAKIVEKGKENDKYFVILDNTEFYPDGKGGQLGDRGQIDGKEVLLVKEINGKILHFLYEIPEENEVICKIDKERRLEISREHTAQHILSRILLNLYNLETLSFHMGDEYSTIDIPYFNFKDEELEKIELSVMKIIDEGREVKKYFIDESELKNYKLRKEEEIREKKIRIVEIENFDITMCGGTHVDNTKDILIFKITKIEKIKGNNLRIYFKTGFRAYYDFLKKDSILRKISKEKLKSVKEEFLKIYLKTKINKKVFESIEFLDQEDLIYLGKEFIKNGANFVYLYNKNFGVIFLNEIKNLNYDIILSKLKDSFNIKGGGKDFISIKLNENGKEIEKFLWKMIE